MRTRLKSVPVTLALEFFWGFFAKELISLVTPASCGGLVCCYPVQHVISTHCNKQTQNDALELLLHCAERTPVFFCVHNAHMTPETERERETETERERETDRQTENSKYTYAQIKRQHT